MGTGTDWTLIFAAVGAAGSGIAALTGVATLWSSVAKRLEERRLRAEAEAARWSISMKHHAGGVYNVSIYYMLANAPDIMVRRFKILEPDAKFCAYRWSAGMPPKLEIYPERFSEVTTSEPTTRGSFAAHRFQSYVEIPERPARCESPTTRLSIRVSFEERCANRRQRQTVVTSEEIPWTARQNANAT